MSTHRIGAWRVDIHQHDLVTRLSSHAALARTMAVALEAAGAPAPASIGLVLTDDAELAALNATHMGKDGPTDVLSFPLLAADDYPPHPGKSATTTRAPAFALPPGRPPHLGDVIVSVERAIVQADEGRGGQTGDVTWAPADELRLLVTHGTLHVCGWDHADPDEEAAMRSLERRLLGFG
jgi:probable rRNA maturation factor